MKRKLLQGDKVLWGLLALLALFSFFPIFSASSNLSYVIGTGSPWHAPHPEGNGAKKVMENCLQVQDHDYL